MNDAELVLSGIEKAYAKGKPSEVTVLRGSASLNVRVTWD